MKHVALSLGTLALVICALPALSAAHPDFSGLWIIDNPSLVVRPEANAQNLTAEAKARIERYQHDYDTAKEDPVQYCAPNGMPWTMLSRARGYLLDIYQTPARLTLIFEYMDTHRVIHFNESGPPPTFTPSSTGYSVARWDGDTLVVTTTALKARNPATLLQRSNQAQISERWRLVKDANAGKAIEVDLSITDPAVYAAPAHAFQRFVPAPPGSVLNTYGCADSLYDDHIKAVDAQRKAAAAAH